MKNQRTLIVLTVLNFGLLLLALFMLTKSSRVDAQSVPAVLRARKLEIVDEQGRVRASIMLHPEDKSGKAPGGKTYPETVMFRLIDQHGRPEVKIGGSELGGVVGLIGKTDETSVLLEADGLETMLRLKNNDGKQQQIKP